LVCRSSDLEITTCIKSQNTVIWTLVLFFFFLFVRQIFLFYFLVNPTSNIPKWPSGLPLGNSGVLWPNLEEKMGQKNSKVVKIDKTAFFQKLQDLQGWIESSKNKSPLRNLIILAEEHFGNASFFRHLVKSFQKTIRFWKNGHFFMYFQFLTCFYGSTNFVVWRKVVPREKWGRNDTSMSRFTNIYEKFTFLTTTQGCQIRIFMWLKGH